MDPAFEQDGMRIFHGDARRIPLEDGCVQTCITSPPYYGLRDYGVEGQIGLEKTPDEYVAAMVEVFREVRRVLKDDGVIWVNIGDSYSASPTGLKRNGTGFGAIFDGRDMSGVRESGERDKAKIPGIKPKDLIGIPWLVAFALRADGWYLRQDIIWHKPGPMPESVRDRCTKAHEYIFLLSKRDRYYFDADAIAEPAINAGLRVHTNGNDGMCDGYDGHRTRDGFKRGVVVGDTRNKRSVWTVAAMPYPGAHFATFPPALVEPCILAGSRPGDLVIDPFSGSGTTGAVAQKWGRRYAGMELNRDYIELSKQRFTQRQLFTSEMDAAARQAEHDVAMTEAMQRPWRHETKETA